MNWTMLILKGEGNVLLEENSLYTEDKWKSIEENETEMDWISGIDKTDYQDGQEDEPTESLGVLKILDPTLLLGLPSLSQHIEGIAISPLKKLCHFNINDSKIEFVPIDMESAALNIIHHCLNNRIEYQAMVTLTQTSQFDPLILRVMELSKKHIIGPRPCIKIQYDIIEGQGNKSGVIHAFNTHIDDAVDFLVSELDLRSSEQVYFHTCEDLGNCYKFGNDIFSADNPL
jgi:hypothetical protein